MCGVEVKVCGYIMEELTLVILILGTVFGAVIIAIWYKKTLNHIKKSQRGNEMSFFVN